MMCGPLFLWGTCKRSLILRGTKEKLHVFFEKVSFLSQISKKMNCKRHNLHIVYDGKCVLQ